MKTKVYHENPADTFKLYTQTPWVIPYVGEQPGDEDHPDYRHPARLTGDIGVIMSAEELADWALYVPAEADPVPDGYQVTSKTVQRVDGVVKYVHQLELIPMDQVQAGFLRDANMHAEQRSTSYLVSYNDNDKGGWSLKSIEASEILEHDAAGNPLGEFDTSRTPIVKSEADFTGETILEVANRILPNYEAYTQISGWSAGLTSQLKVDLPPTTTYAEAKAVYDTQIARFDAFVDGLEAEIAKQSKKE